MARSAGRVATAKTAGASKAGTAAASGLIAALPGTSELLATYGLFFAEAALSGVRHELLNRMTALGALSYELGRALSGGPSLGEPSVAQERLADLNRQIAATAMVAGRRLEVPRRVREACEVRATIAGLVQVGRWPAPIHTGGDAAVRARIAPIELAVALLCLIDNAIEATGHGRAPDVTVSHAPLSGGRLQVTVEDRGRGLDEPERSFERFFTSKPGHAGLGLCVTRRVAERWEGEVSLAAREGGGTRAILILPTVGARGGGRS